MRGNLVTAGVMGLELLVMLHWFMLPDSAALAWLALVAGGAMCLLALAAFLQLVGVLRGDPADPHQRRVLAELATVEARAVVPNATHVVFTAAAFLAGVYWVAAALVLGLGSGLTAFLYARRRLTSSG
jgi:hypothetical protein